MASSATASFDDLFPAQNTEVDVSLEWLSIFVEDCLSSTGNCIIPLSEAEVATPNPITKPLLQQQPKPQQKTPPFLQKFVVPSKAKRSKRKRAKNPFFSTWSYHQNPLQLAASSDPPLLHQAYWLADSELVVVPKKNKDCDRNFVGKIGVEESKKEEKMVVSKLERNSGLQQQQQQRRCSHCLAQRTPQWRAGPLGPKTLCNACGVRYKSGRLLPEYRPAKSPTFVSYLHSNSHVKVMEMRMMATTTLSSIPNEH